MTTEFLNYTVDLFLKDGSRSTGRISAVDPTQITLNDVDQSTVPGQKVPTAQFKNSFIADLKVTKLPPDLLKSLQKRAKIADNGKKEAKSKPKNKKEDGISELEDNKAVSDLKVSNDFDFAANLAMFDKKTVFEDFQRKDHIKPENRLVGHNKVTNAKPKGDQEKFRNDEMVLESGKADNWDLLGNNMERKESLRNASITGRPGTPINDLSTSSLLSKNYSLLNLSTRNTIPVCSPIQLLDIERIAADTLGFLQTLMAEVCSSNLSLFISQTILGGSSRLNPNNHNLPPLVLLLIGNERCSARAFSVGRQLSNHGIRVLAYVVSQTVSSDETYLQQKSMFQQAGGKIITDTVANLLDILNNKLNTPVELIIDALQGYDDHLEDIFYEPIEQEQIKELISWCNQPSQSNKIMSLDIPSGIDGGSGTIMDLALTIRCKWCVSMGIPVAGITHAYRNEYLQVGEDHDIIHLLVDIGIPNKVYQQKSNLRRFDKIWYGAENVVKMNVIES